MIYRIPRYNRTKLDFEKRAFMIDQDVVLEYQRLADIANTNPHLFS
jgi:hypothetical protein